MSETSKTWSIYFCSIVLTKKSGMFDIVATENLCSSIACCLLSPQEWLKESDWKEELIMAGIDRILSIGTPISCMYN